MLATIVIFVIKNQILIGKGQGNVPKHTPTHSHTDQREHLSSDSVNVNLTG